MEQGQRRNCSNCGKRRMIVVAWDDTQMGLCQECSKDGNRLLAYSMRGLSVGVQVA